MLFLMTATPLAMLGHHHSYDSAALVIEWHVFGMFAASYVTGLLVQRWGAARVIAFGIYGMLLCVAISLAGDDVHYFWAALLLLGAGWNLTFVASTALLTEVCSEAERASAQGMNELAINSVNALACLASGACLSRLGWKGANLVTLPFLLAPLLLLVRMRSLRRVAGAASRVGPLED